MLRALLRWLLERSPWLLLAVAALAVGWTARGDPEPVYRTVRVPVPVIERTERVDTLVRWRERVVYRTAIAETRAVADSGGVSDVEAFCGERGDSTNLGVIPSGDDVVPPRSPTLLLRSVRVDAGWFFGPDEVVLTGPLSDGGLAQFRYSLRPDWQGRVMADSLFVQTSRWWWAREVVEAGAYMGAGYLLGRILQ